eukprot:11176004-Lingulodinium_polyedra.AAC.1
MPTTRPLGDEPADGVAVQVQRCARRNAQHHAHHRENAETGFPLHQVLGPRGLPACERAVACRGPTT